MAYFVINHSAAPLLALVEAFDEYDAARKYKRAVEQANGSEIVDGETLEVVRLDSDTIAAVLNTADAPRYEWADDINNFRKVEA